MSGAARDREVVRLDVPRTVVAEVARTRRGETKRLAVLEPVAVSLASLRSEDAPVVLRLPPAKGGGACDSWRLLDGAFYRPFLCDRDLGATPAEASERIAIRASFHVGRPTAALLQANPAADHATRLSGERFVNLSAAFDRVEGERGIGTIQGHGIRRIVDPGDGDLPAIIERIGRDLVLVDGRLHHRSPAPGYALRGADGRDGWFRLEALDPYLDGMSKPSGSTQAWTRFGPHRADEAMRMMAEIPAEDWFAMSEPSRRGRPFEVLDAEAVAAAVPDETPHAFALACVEGFAALAGPSVHAFSDDVVEAYLDLRRAWARLSAGGDPGEAFEVLRAFAGRVEAEEPPDANGKPGRLTIAGRSIALRHDLIERPRNGLEPIRHADDAALSLLGR